MSSPLPGARSRRPGDVDVLLLDKTGTITLGNRQAAAFMPAAGVTEEELADAAQLASLADETPEGRSIVVLAKQRFQLRERDLASLGATFVHFSAHTRMSGVDIGDAPDPQGRRRCDRQASGGARRGLSQGRGRAPCRRWRAAAARRWW